MYTYKFEKKIDDKFYFSRSDCNIYLIIKEKNIFDYEFVNYEN